MTAKQAVIYARVSTSRQADDDVSIPAQVERGREKAAELGADVVRVFCDEGLTGTDDRRQAFQDAIAFCELYSPDFFITWSTSRFSRNKIDAALYKLRLDRCGTSIVYLCTPIDRDTDSGWMLESMLEVFDEYYSRQISADTKRSMIKNAREGYWNGGAPPFGYRPEPAEDNPRRRRLKIYPPEAEIVELIFNMRLAGQGAKAIATVLNERGITHRGSPWQKGSILYILRSESYIGHVIFNRRDRKTMRDRDRKDWIVVQSHDPIISPETFESVQAMLNTENPGRGTGSHASRFLFTGLLRCGKCGASLQIESAKGRSRRYHYYNCRTAQQKGGCKNRRLPAHELDDWLLDQLLDQILNAKTVANVYLQLAKMCSGWAKDQQRRRQAVLSEIRVIERKTRKIYELFEEYGKDTPNLGDMTRRLRAHNSRLKSLERQLAAIEAEVPPEMPIQEDQVMELVYFLIDTIKSSENVKKTRGLLSRFIREIVITDDHAQVNYDNRALIELTARGAVPSKEWWLPEHAILGTKIVTLFLPQRFCAAA